jgi:hypothetical protein
MNRRIVMTTPASEETLTLADIQTRFDSEWVLIDDPEFDDRSELIRGKVLWHSKDRDEVYRKDLELRPRSAAYVFTGKMPKDTVVVL